MQAKRSSPIHLVTALIISLALLVSACDSASNNPDVDRNDLSSMQRARITISGHEFEVWVARTAQEQRLGLMHVEASQLAPTDDGAIRGMLFVFDSEQPRSFWMKDTPTALDIAYMKADGTIVTILTMAPFDTSSYPSGEPAKFALEVLAGTFEDLDITEGEHAIIPP
jgi:uncharacterized membrane protein (UPF0127 family)